MLPLPLAVAAAVALSRDEKEAPAAREGVSWPLREASAEGVVAPRSEGVGAPLRVEPWVGAGGAVMAAETLALEGGLSDCMAEGVVKELAAAVTVGEALPLSVEMGLGVGGAEGPGEAVAVSCGEDVALAGALCAPLKDDLPLCEADGEGDAVSMDAADADAAVEAVVEADTGAVPLGSALPVAEERAEGVGSGEEEPCSEADGCPLAERGAVPALLAVAPLSVAVGAAPVALRAARPLASAVAEGEDWGEELSVGSDEADRDRAAVAERRGEVVAATDSVSAGESVGAAPVAVTAGDAEPGTMLTEPPPLLLAASEALVAGEAVAEDGGEGVPGVGVPVPTEALCSAVAEATDSEGGAVGEELATPEAEAEAVVERDEDADPDKQVEAVGGVEAVPAPALCVAGEGLVVAGELPLAASAGLGEAGEEAEGSREALPLPALGDAAALSEPSAVPEAGELELVATALSAEVDERVAAGEAEESAVAVPHAPLGEGVPLGLVGLGVDATLAETEGAAEGAEPEMVSEGAAEREEEVEGKTLADWEGEEVGEREGRALLLPVAAPDIVLVAAGEAVAVAAAVVERDGTAERLAVAAPEAVTEGRGEAVVDASPELVRVGAGLALKEAAADTVAVGGSREAEAADEGDPPPPPLLPRPPPLAEGAGVPENESAAEEDVDALRAGEGDDCGEVDAVEAALKVPGTEPLLQGERVAANEGEERAEAEAEGGAVEELELIGEPLLEESVLPVAADVAVPGAGLPVAPLLPVPHMDGEEAALCETNAEAEGVAAPLGVDVAATLVESVCSTVVVPV